MREPLACRSASAKNAVACRGLRVGPSKGTFYSRFCRSLGCEPSDELEEDFGPGGRNQKNPVLHFLGFLISLVFVSLSGASLVFWVIFPSFPGFSGVGKEQKIPGVLGVSLVFAKKPRKRRGGKVWKKSRANREVQTVNWEGGGERAVERGVESGLKKAHKPWIRGKKGAQTVN